MANYKETKLEGEIIKWRRMTHGTIYNAEIPKIQLHHEDRTILPDGTTISKYIGELNYTMTDPTIEIPLINPETFEPTEQTMKAGEIWLAMASVYLWLARQQ